MESLTIPKNTAASVVENERPAQTIIIEDNARLHYVATVAGDRLFILGRGAQLDCVDASVGAAVTSSVIRLAGEGAHAKYRSAHLASGDDSYAATVTMIHEASNTSSNMLSRVALLGKSNGKYRGLIRILPYAKHCDAHQHEDTLLLGDESRMDAVPVLEIMNDDVKCGHGVTLGQVDEEKLFYLQSRGLPRQQAKMAIVQGFFDQLLISMGDSGAKTRSAMAQLLERD